MGKKQRVTTKDNSLPKDQKGPSLKELTARLHLEEKQEALFIEAFTHSSYANEHRMPSNERLEFLGDSVLGLLVCQYLYLHYPSYDEGQLAKIKAILVSATFFATFSRQIALDKYILLGAGEIHTGGNAKPNILADLFEAFIGAYYLSFGLSATNEFLTPFIESALPEIFAESEKIDAKTYLQELAQSQGLKPEYHLIAEEGPPHNKTFTVEVLIDGKVYGSGTGKSLKEAQNKAASVAAFQIKQ
ncbi:MAG TPA: ribonuclease III [Firmicutes bacterium]|jgi:ribonuclease III|nr:ribonuclease III [Bacillota bacterium]